MKTQSKSRVLICPALPLAVLLGMTIQVTAQQVHVWTERENFGFKGDVHSARTTVSRPNPDPRPEPKPGTWHHLHPEGHSDWKVFDQAGQSIEFVGSIRGDEILSTTKCTYGVDGARTCEDSAGKRHERSEQRSVLPDGRLEVKHLQDAQVESREVTQFDKDGKPLIVKHYGRDDKLASEDLTLPEGDRWKLYDPAGTVNFDMFTVRSTDEDKAERWFYNAIGQPIAHLAIGKDSQLLQHWYEVGYKSRQSSSDSLGVCRPGLCVSYQFDIDGSGRLDKTVQHTHESGNTEPDREEHYNVDGNLDEKAEIKYVRDEHGNWTSRSVFVWDLSTNVPVEIERDTRSLEYYR